MRYTLKQIKESLPQNKANKEPVWSRLFVRRFSYYITYLLINTKITANTVSLFSALVALAGCLVMCINNRMCIWIGIILLNLWSVLDCVDGNMARCRKQTSLAGEFFDALSGYTVGAFCMLGFGLAAYNTTQLVADEYKIFLIILSMAGGICDIFGRLIYQKYSNNMIKMEYERIGENGVKTENDGFYNNGSNTLLKKISLFVDYEFGIGGDELLFLIIAALFNIIDIFALCYALYHIAGAVLIVFMYAKKMAAYEKKYLKNEP